MMRIIDNNRIGIRNINTIFHNGRRKQHIIVIVDKTHDNLFQLLRLHLTMSDGNSAIRYMLLYQKFYLLKFGNPIIDKIHLSITTHFKIDGISNHF